MDTSLRMMWTKVLDHLHLQGLPIYGNPSHEAPIHSSCADVNARERLDYADIKLAEYRRLLRTQHSVTSHALPLCG